MQIIKGTFKIIFRGIPLFFVSKSELVAETGSTVIVYSIHITPFIAFGFVMRQ